MDEIEPETGSSAESITKHRKKPKGTAFRQQQLRAVHPVVTARNVMPGFWVLAILFVPIGIWLFVMSENLKELEIPYTDCMSIEFPKEQCSSIVNFSTPAISCTCEVETKETIGPGWTPDVMVYYGLSNFYQNHRSYVKSRDDDQLLGNIFKVPNEDCKPWDQREGKRIIPCGAIANSMFSDSIRVFYLNSTTQIWTEVDLIRTGIAWEADKKYKFKNPPLGNKTSLKEVFLFANYTRPPMWPKDLWELDPEDESNNGLQNEDLMVWMRTAALPNFRKLYRKIKHEGELKDGLPDAKFKFIIDYHFDVKTFSGTKSIILAQTSVTGGKNPFLGIAYLTIGCLCIVLAIIFLIIHLRYGKLLTETML